MFVFVGLDDNYALNAPSHWSSTVSLAHVLGFVLDSLAKVNKVPKAVRRKNFISLIVYSKDLTAEGGTPVD